MIEQGKPFYLDVEQLFGGQQRHRAQIADKVNHRYEETYIPLDSETSDKPVEENRLESQVSDIQRQAFNEKPHHGREVERIVMIRHIRHGEASGNHQGHQPKQRTDIAAEEDEQGRKCLK